MGVWPSGRRVRRWRPRGDVENRACKTNARHEDLELTDAETGGQRWQRRVISPPLPRITSYR
jgi:hypothetical protein